MGHYVYKYVKAGEIVYIGKNDTNLADRIYQHKLEEKFIPYADAEVYYIELANAIMSDVVESELIRRYKPKLNKAKMSDWVGIPFIEPDWKLFKERKKSTERKQTGITNSDKGFYRKLKNFATSFDELSIKKSLASYVIEHIDKLQDIGEKYVFEVSDEDFQDVNEFVKNAPILWCFDKAYRVEGHIQYVVKKNIITNERPTPFRIRQQAKQDYAEIQEQMEAAVSKFLLKLHPKEKNVLMTVDMKDYMSHLCSVRYYTDILDHNKRTTNDP